MIRHAETGGYVDPQTLFATSSWALCQRIPPFWLPFYVDTIKTNCSIPAFNFTVRIQKYALHEYGACFSRTYLACIFRKLEFLFQNDPHGSFSMAFMDMKSVRIMEQGPEVDVLGYFGAAHVWKLFFTVNTKRV